MKIKFFVILFNALHVYCYTILAVAPKVKDIQVLSNLNILYRSIENNENTVETSRFHVSKNVLALFNLNPISDRIERNEVEIQYNYGYNFTTKDDECIAFIKPLNTNTPERMKIGMPYCVLQKYCLENNGNWELDFASEIYDNVQLVTTNKEPKNANILYGSECDGVDGYFNCFSYVYKILNNGKLLKVFEGIGTTSIMGLEKHIEQTASNRKGDTIEVHYSIEDAGKYDEKKDSITMFAVKEICLFDHVDSKKIYYQNVRVKFKIELIADKFRYYDYKTETLLESIGE